MSTINTPELLQKLDLLPESFWYNQGFNTDLLVRRMAGEYNPRPYISIHNFLHRIPSLGSVSRVDVMSELAEDALRNGRIDEQEERLLGRNRQATNEQRVALWLVAIGLCQYCEILVVSTHHTSWTLS